MVKIKHLSSTFITSRKKDWHTTAEVFHSLVYKTRLIPLGDDFANRLQIYPEPKCQIICEKKNKNRINWKYVNVSKNSQLL